MHTYRDSQPLKHKPDLMGMVVGDFFYFCDECGYQHKKNYVISGRCHCGAKEKMFQCTVTKEDLA